MESRRQRHRLTHEPPARTPKEPRSEWCAPGRRAVFFKATRLPPPIIFIRFIDELTAKGVARADVTASRAGVDPDAATILL